MSGRGLIWSLLGILAILLARRYVDVVEVRGRSMMPTLRPGDRLLVIRASARIGDVVVVLDPRDCSRELIKRVVAADASGVTLRGDNVAASTDARTFGAIPTTMVHWRVVGRYWPLSRVGRVGRPPSAPVIEGGEARLRLPEAMIAGG